MNTINTLIFLIILCIVAALIISLLLSIRTTRKLVDEKNRLARKPQNSDPVTPPPAPDAPTPFSTSDSGFMEWFGQRMDQTKLYLRSDISLKTLANELGISQRKITLALKADPRYGSLNEYLTAKRLEEACRLLRQKPFYKIESISQDAGFCSRKTFLTLLKKRIGMTPSEYRMAASTDPEPSE